jgi:diguanylate cyclase (GGDEF)-like protein
MPKMNGLEMAQKIREIDKNIPIVVTSSYSESKYLLEAIDQDVTSYLLKPISYETLKKKIEQVAHSVFLEKKLIKSQKVVQAAIDLYDGVIVEISNGEVDFINESFKNLLENENPSYPSLCEFFQCEDLLQTLDAQSDKILKAKNGNSYLVNETKVDRYTSLFIMNDVTQMVHKTDELEKQSVTDTLTGAFNRNKFDQSMVYYKESFLRYKTKFSVVLFDIDHFKPINDTYGHAVGDKALVTLAKLIQNSVRITDVFARWGGEEFAILLPETELEGARIVATNLRNLIKIQKFDTIGHLTCSFGVAEYRGNESVDDFFERLDGALYRAKEEGRDRVEVAASGDDA